MMSRRDMCAPELDVDSRCLRGVIAVAGRRRRGCSSSSTGDTAALVYDVRRALCAEPKRMEARTGGGAVVRHGKAGDSRDADATVRSGRADVLLRCADKDPKVEPAAAHLATRRQAGHRVSRRRGKGWSGGGAATATTGEIPLQGRPRQTAARLHHRRRPDRVGGGWPARSNRPLQLSQHDRRGVAGGDGARRRASTRDSPSCAGAWTR